MTKRFAAGLLSVALLASLLLAGGPYAGTAHACSCAGSQSVEEGLRAADAVFSGEMIRGGIEDPDPEDDIMLGGIEFRVIESWKGVSGESAVVYGQDTAYYGELEEEDMVVVSSCAYPFEEGRNYLIYASRYEDGFQVGGCDRTTSLAGAEKDLRVLGPPSEQLTDTGGPRLPPAGGVMLAAVLLILLTGTVLDRALRWGPGR